MTLYQYISEEILKESWEPILSSFISNKKLKQLLTLKPIEIFEHDLNLDFEGANVQVELKSYVENIIEKRLSNPFHIFDFTKWLSQKSLPTYKFQVFAIARMDFKNATYYLTKNFANVEYILEEGKYKFTINQIHLGYENKCLFVDLDITGVAKWWKLEKIIEGKLRITGNLRYIADKKMIITKDLDFSIIKSNFIVKQIDKKHHLVFKEMLVEFLRLNISEELFNARIAAQEELNNAQNDPSYFVNGVLNDMQVEKIYSNEKGIRATIVINGRLHLNR